jgi:predicted transposase YdaD
MPDLVFELEDGRILHVELQVDNDSTMPWRMLQYYSVLRRGYADRLVIQIVVYVGNGALRMPRLIREKVLRFRYRLLDIREFSAELFLGSESSAERALALLCPVRDAREIIRQVLESWAEVPYDQKNNLIETLVIVSGLRGLKRVVQEELPSMAINTEVLIRDNEWFQEWKEIGVAEGRTQGLNEGRLNLLKRQIGKKFGSLPRWAEDRLDKATVEQLDEWGDRILDASTLEKIFE